ncbi:MAG: hypothetical protein ACK5HH_05305 [Ignavibacteria bacterium]|jgi:hypothetical protein
MFFRSMIFIVGLILLLSNPIDAQARKKRKASKKKTVQVIKPAKKFFHEEGHFTIAFPGTHGQVKGDTSLISTAFGQTQFYAYTTNSVNSASMIAYYELDMKKVAEKDDNLAQNSKILLDTLQAQLIANLGGTVQRKVKMVREGLYHSRISYFTVKGEGDKTVYFRCENIINAPRVYQLLYQTSVKSGPDSPEAKKFFQSFSLKVKR